MDDEPWYVNAVMYGLDVSRFQDGNGDGIGDFQGLLSRLDHLVSLGVTCLWLLPFFDSPRHDNGYDVRGSRPVWGAPDVLWDSRA